MDCSCVDVYSSGTGLLSFIPHKDPFWELSIVPGQGAGLRLCTCKYGIRASVGLVILLNSKAGKLWLWAELAPQLFLYTL